MTQVSGCESGLSAEMNGSASESRVLHFIDTWLRPSEQFVHGLVTRLRHPHVVVSSLGLENVQRFPVSPLVSLQPLCARLPGRLRPPTVTAGLLGTAMRHRVSLIHVHHGYGLHEVGTASRLLRLPLVVSLHGHDVTGYIEEHPTIYRGVLDRVNAAVVPSKFLADVAIAAGCRPEAVHVIPSGVDTSWFSPTPLPDGPPVVLFVGRFVAKKGLDVLLEAWREVSRAVPEACLRLLGFGPLEPLARSAGPGVEVTVAPTHAEVRDAMRRATVLASPSRTAPDDAVESLLIVNLEAQASGRPVVTTRHGAIPEFVAEGQTAIIVPEADASALAEALVSVLRERELAERLVRPGQRVLWFRPPRGPSGAFPSTNHRRLRKG
jgi:colanic acid/amylovoran biosynthesis glycosyltransferase